MQLASSETVMFWSDNVVVTTIHVTTPAIAMMTPITIDRIETVFLIVAPFGYSSGG
jgi:hypothetical protein